jgi:3-dehydroquinate synthase
MLLSIVDVSLKDNTYDIIIEKGALAHAADYLIPLLPSKKICIVTDETIAKLYLFPLMKALEAAGFTCYPPIIIPAGEKSKNFVILQQLVEKSLSYKLDRKSTLIALGGGVVGDITGFAASIIMRGIHFVQIPTTLLAQVDSSVGGKTGINTLHGKNLVGSFYQPKLVLIDTDMLQTLPLRELKAGYAEILKYALMSDADFFHWLEENAQGILNGDAEKQRYAIEKSCRIKSQIVIEDETETKDIRALLNLGHSFGHALEALGGYDGRLLHGEAVGIGMKWAFEFSQFLGFCPKTDAAKIGAHLTKNHMMTKPPFPVSAADVLEKMRGDKKNSHGTMTLILAKGIGQTFVYRDAGEAKLNEFLHSVCISE